jgi:hypothetical protein
MNTQDNNSLPDSAAVCTGIGMHHTNHPLKSNGERRPDSERKPYTTITLNEIRALVDNPESKPKDNG